MKEIYKLYQENPNLRTVNIIHLHPTNQLGMGKTKRFQISGFNIALREKIFIGYADTVASYYKSLDLRSIRIMNDNSIKLTFKREVEFEKEEITDILRIKI